MSICVSVCCMLGVLHIMRNVSDCLELASQALLTGTMESLQLPYKSRISGLSEFLFPSVQMNMTTEFALWLLSMGSMVSPYISLLLFSSHLCPDCIFTFNQD